MFSKSLLMLLLALPLWAVTNSVTIYETGSATQTNRVIILPRFFAEGEITNYAQPVINGTPATSWQCDRRSQWDSDSSLQWAIISFKASLPADGSVTVTFQPNANPCSSGNEAACNSDSLDEAGMLAFASSTWGGKIKATQNSTTRTADVRTIVDAADFTYLLRGPVVTQVLVEDATTDRAYDFGWTCSTNCTGDYTSATWANDTTDKSLHPRFIVTFPDGLGGVRVQPMIENLWTTKLQDQRYSVLITDNDDNTEATISEFTQWGRTRRSKGMEFWDLDEPDSIRIDYNLEYLVDSRILPSYDTTVTASSAAISSMKSAFDADDCSWGEKCTHSSKGFSSSQESAMLEVWEALYVFSFDDDMKTVTDTNCEVGQSIPMHYRELDTGRYFVDLDENGIASDDGVDAVGYFISIDARDDFRASEPFDTGSWTHALTPLATLSSSGGWGIDIAHQPAYCAASYLTTGDQYYLEELQYWSAWNLSLANPGTCHYCRYGNWGYISEAAAQVRGQGWSKRTLGYAGLFSTGHARTYLLQKLKYQAAVDEGFYDIQDGDFYNDATHGAKWTWGRDTVADGESNPLGYPNSHLETYVGTPGDPTKTCSTNSHFMYYMKYAAEAWLRDVGFSWWDKILEAQAALPISILVDTTSSSPYLVTSYQYPITDYDGDCGDGNNPYFTDPADIYDALTGDGQTDLQAYFEARLGAVQYVTKAKAGVAGMTGYTYNGYSGADAWDWIDAAADNASVYPANPQWAIVPRSAEALGQPRIITPSLPSGTVGEDYYQTLSATDGQPPYTWSVSAGLLCSGLSLSSSGVISGSASSSGTCSFTIQVSDANSSLDARGFSITIGDPAGDKRSRLILGTVY